MLPASPSATSDSDQMMERKVKGTIGLFNSMIYDGQTKFSPWPARERGGGTRVPNVYPFVPYPPLLLSKQFPLIVTGAFLAVLGILRTGKPRTLQVRLLR